MAEARDIMTTMEDATQMRVEATVTQTSQLSEWHYRETINTCTYYLCEEYTIACKVDSLILRMFSRGYISEHDTSYIRETIHTHDKLTQLLTTIKEAKTTTIKDAFDEMLLHFSDDNRPDISDELRKSLEQVSKLEPQSQEETLRDRVKRQTDNFMYVSPFELQKTQKMMLAEFDKWKADGSWQHAADVQTPTMLLYEHEGEDTEISPLMEAAIKDDVHNLERILENTPGSNINSDQNRKGQTVLIVAVQHASVRFVRTLLATGLIDINATDNEGCTAFMYTVMRGDIGIIDALLDCDELDVSICDNFGLGYEWYLFGKMVVKELQSKVKVQNDKREVKRILENFVSNMKDMQGKLNWDRIQDIVKILLSSARINNAELLKTMLLMGSETIVSLILQSDNVDINTENVVDIILKAISSHNPKILQILTRSTKIPFESLDNKSVKTIWKHAHSHSLSNTGELIYCITKGPNVDKALRLVTGFLSMDQYVLSGLMDGYDIIDINKLNVKDYKGNSIFMLLCQYGGYKLISQLLKHTKIDVSCTNAKQQTALMRSFKNSSKSVPILLYEYSKSILEINGQDSNGKTNLILASKYGNDDMVRILLRDPTIEVNHGSRILHVTTPLMWASMKGHVSVVSLLIAGGADINLTNWVGQTALHMACRNGHDAIVSQLIQGGADVHMTYWCGMTPLHTASGNGHDSVVEQLLASDVDINQKDILRRSALHHACDENQLSTMTILINNGADMTANDVIYGSVLRQACKSGNIPVASALIASGADMHTKDIIGETILMETCKRGQVPVVSLLIASGVDINQTSDIGANTALHKACHAGQYHVVVKLLEVQNININARNVYDQTALDIARHEQNDDIAQLLLEKKAKRSLHVPLNLILAIILFCLGLSTLSMHLPYLITFIISVLRVLISLYLLYVSVMGFIATVHGRKYIQEIKILWSEPSHLTHYLKTWFKQLKRRLYTWTTRNRLHRMRQTTSC